MTDITQRERGLALTLYSAACDDATSEWKALILAALSDVRREALARNPTTARQTNETRQRIVPRAVQNSSALAV